MALTLIAQILFPPLIKYVQTVTIPAKPVVVLRLIAVSLVILLILLTHISLTSLAQVNVLHKVMSKIPTQKSVRSVIPLAKPATTSNSPKNALLVLLVNFSTIKDA